MFCHALIDQSGFGPVRPQGCAVMGQQQQQQIIAFAGLIETTGAAFDFTVPRL